jgi:hypothetical protein
MTSTLDHSDRARLTDGRDIVDFGTEGARRGKAICQLLRTLGG